MIGLWRKRLPVSLLAIMLIASGTPQVLARDTAVQAQREQSLEAAERTRLQQAEDGYTSTGAPPDDDRYRAMSAPTPSNANPLYPTNHGFDAQASTVGTPPANHDLETAAQTVGTPPANHDLQSAPSTVGTPPTDHDFASGTLANWTTSGTVSIQSDAPHGSYAQLGTGGLITSAAFSVDAAATAVVLDLGLLGTTGSQTVYVKLLSGADYSTSTTLGQVTCSACGAWQTKSFSVVAWSGQSVKLQVQRSTGTIGADNVHMEAQFPNYTTAGKVVREVEAGGNGYAALQATGASLTTAAFTVAADAQFGTVKVKGLSVSNDAYKVFVLSGPTYATATEVYAVSNTADSWTTASFNLTAYRGQSIKLRVDHWVGSVGVDDIGAQTIGIPGWEFGANLSLGAGVSGNALQIPPANTPVTSSAFALPADVQHLSMQYKSVAGSSFYLELLRGANFDQVVDLAGFMADASTSEWKTIVVSVSPYAGETVKLRVRQWIGTGLYDNVGVMPIAVPHWKLTTNQAIQTGTDANGSYVQAYPKGIASAAYLRSIDISNGLIDEPNKQQQRYFAVSYDIGYSTGSILKVWWHNPATGQNWVVHQDTANSPTGYRTSYFWIADWMGADGYFVVQAPSPTYGKLYGIADNIARMHLNEPFSEHVGMQIDTSTGSFGYQKQDLATEGQMPLIFTRYYAAHSDQSSVLGYRWTHSYETRLVTTSDGDAGVILGSGREIYFDWYAVFTDPPNRFEPADPRVHETLVKNGDGTYTFTTTSNLKYLFTAAGRLTSITDLNGNAVTLTYNGSSQLTTVTDPGGRSLTLAYNAQGRLQSVTDPVGEVVQYGYDANGDLTTITDQGNGIWTNSYNAHRLTQAKGPDNVAIFTNMLDSKNRVTTQTLADNSTLQVAYDTPAKGVTSVTDPEGETAKYYFDRYGRTNHKVDPLNRAIEFLYDGTGNRTKIIDPANNEWQFIYDGSGNLTTYRDATGNPLSIVYNALHLPTTTTDACGNVSTFTYDTAGNITSIKNALNQTTTYTHNSRGQILTETNPLNQTTTYTYNAQGNRTSMTDALNHTWSWTYDLNGRVLTETDANGKTTTYVYDPFGHLTTIRDALGNETRFQHDGYGYLLWQEDHLGNRTRYAYDSRGFMINMRDPAGKVWTYTYDDNGNRLTETDPLNHTTTFTYDASNRLATVTNPLGATTSYTYNAAGRVTTVTDALNRSISYGYDAEGRITSITLPNGGIVATTYDACGNQLSSTDPLGRVSSTTYDALHRMATETDKRGKVTSYTYNAAGRLATVTNPINGVTTYGYDAAGRLTTVTDPLNRTTTHGYDAQGNRTSVTDALNHATTIGYDALNRVISFTNALNQTTAYTYDAAGRRTRVTLPSGNYTDYAYDARSLLTSVTTRLGYVMSYAYDNAGRLTSMTDPNNRTTTYGYDNADRRTTMTDALGGVVTFAYDAAGHTTSVTNPRGKTTTFTYNTLGRVLTETDPLNRTKTYTYDLAGRMTGMTDPRSTAVSYAYDNAGNPTSVTYPGGSISYAYDDLGRRTSMTDGTGTTTWTYDAASQVTSVAAPGNTVGYGYDAAGRRTSMTYPGNRTVTYGYDTANRMTSLTDWQQRTIAFAYNADGQRTGITRPNGVTTTYGYDLAGRLTSVVHGGGGLGSNTSFSYTLDAAGNRTAVTGSRGTETFTLDALNRVTNVAYPNGDTAAYTYDANGNRLTEVVNGATTATYTYDNADQLTSDGTRSYTYDQAGNLLTAGADTYTWDWKSRLTGATVSGQTSSFTYDGDDVRISQTVGANTTTYVWDRLSGLPLLLDDGTNAYLHADGVQSQIGAGNAASYPLADALGSVRTMTDGAGAPTGTADYAVFGAVRASTGTLGTFSFTGEQRDASNGLTYLRARYYSAALGRFLSADTVQPNAPGTQGYNRYAYTANNPTTWTDPSGHVAAAAPAVVPGSGALAALAELSLTPGASARLTVDILNAVKSASGFPEVAALGMGLAAAVAASVVMGVGTGTASVLGEQLGLASFAIVYFALANLYLMLAAPGLARIVSLVIGIILILWSVALLYLTLTILATVLDAWEYFPDAVVPTQPPESKCVEGAVENAVEEAAWIPITGAGPDAFELAAEMVYGCLGAEHGPKNDGSSGGSGGRDDPCSFSADTEVATTEGERRISTIKVGDRVLAYDEATGQTDDYTVTAVWVHIDPVVEHLAIDGEVIETTPEHPFFSEERGWVAAGDLRIGEQVRSADGDGASVESIAFEQRSQPMYNLTVEQVHTYFVSDNKVLVHNECPDASQDTPDISQDTLDLWHKSTHDTTEGSVAYHWELHGEPYGVSIEEYTQDAVDFFNMYADTHSQPVTLKDGTPGVYIEVDGAGGYYTTTGEVVSFWYE